MARSILSAPHFQNEAAAFEYVEAHLWPKGPTCPHCGNADTAKIGRLNGKTTRPGLRKCYACRKPFTVRIGSIFEDSKLALHLWLQVIHLMCSSKKGIATRQIQRMLQCSMKTAWFLTHRIREAMATRGDMLPPLGGQGVTVEADETYVGAEAGRKKWRKPVEKHIVMTLVERNGIARSFHVSNVRADTVGRVLSQTKRGTTLMTDDARVYRDPPDHIARHDSVAHAYGEYVRDDVHTNTVEGFFSILKRGLFGTYQSVSEAHLHRYLSEFDFRYSNRAKLGIDDSTRTGLTVRAAKGKRLTYETATR